MPPPFLVLINCIILNPEMHSSYLIITIICSFILFSCNSEHTYQDEIFAFQDELNEFYSNSKTSPLKPDELTLFKANGEHAFFPIDSAFRVRAFFLPFALNDTVQMPTSSEKIKSFLKEGTANFTLLGKTYSLVLYRSLQLVGKQEYEDYLFLPFKDMTSGKLTYGGGRYIDLKTPQGDSITIDFNKAYHPYCAYTKGYSCPIPPAENYLELPIEAGIKLSTSH